MSSQSSEKNNKKSKKFKKKYSNKKSSSSNSRSRSRKRRSRSRSQAKNKNHNKDAKKQTQKRSNSRENNKKYSYQNNSKQQQQYGKREQQKKQFVEDQFYDFKRRENEQKNQEYQQKDFKYQNKDQKQEEIIEKEQINFEATGILAKYQNNVNGVTIKFTEPMDAAVPNELWKIFTFKGEEAQDTITLRESSSFLFGKDLRVADIPLENPSCSGQHAVIQFREKKINNGIGEEIDSIIKPYLMDLESTNGTFLNNTKIEAARYYELMDQDIIKFGLSLRDYVVMKPL